jgi:hypothetical protein
MHGDEQLRLTPDEPQSRPATERPALAEAA